MTETLLGIIVVVDLLAFALAGFGGLALIASIFVPSRRLANFALAAIGAGLGTGLLVLAVTHWIERQ